jgi:hypothetical protein
VDVTRTPPGERFDAVLSVRLLHHLEEPAFAAALDFLTGSAKEAIVCTFASSSTWKGWLRALRRPRAPGGRGEVLRSRAAVESAFRARGWAVADAACVSPLFSTQVWLLLTPAR